MNFKGTRLQKSAKSWRGDDLADFWSRVPLKFISAFIFESILPKFRYDEGGNI